MTDAVKIYNRKPKPNIGIVSRASKVMSAASTLKISDRKTFKETRETGVGTPDDQEQDIQEVLANFDEK